MTTIGWLMSGDTGISSKTIFGVMVGEPMTNRPLMHNSASIPYDPSDFGRCYRLLQNFPEWRARLGEVADEHPDWAPFVAAWDELTALYEEEIAENTGKGPRLYARMREIREGLMQAAREKAKAQVTP